MHDKIDLAPFGFEIGEDRIDAFDIGHVAVAREEGIQFDGQWFDALFQSIALPGQRDFRTLIATGLGNPQAMERLLATPMMTPRLPAMRPEP